MSQLITTRTSKTSLNSWRKDLHFFNLISIKKCGINLVQWRSKILSRTRRPNSCLIRKMLDRSLRVSITGTDTVSKACSNLERTYHMASVNRWLQGTPIDCMRECLSKKDGTVLADCSGRMVSTILASLRMAITMDTENLSKWTEMFLRVCGKEVYLKAEWGIRQFFDQIYW